MAVTDNRQRALDISEQIATLSAELNRLLRLEALDLNRVPPDPVPPVVPDNPAPPPPDSFSVGSRVQITNNYRGLRGQQGTVTRVTRVFIFLVLSSYRNWRCYLLHLIKMLYQPQGDSTFSSTSWGNLCNEKLFECVRSTLYQLVSYYF